MNNDFNAQAQNVLHSICFPIPVNREETSRRWLIDFNKISSLKRAECASPVVLPKEGLTSRTMGNTGFPKKLFTFIPIKILYWFMIAFLILLYNCFKHLFI